MIIDNLSGTISSVKSQQLAIIEIGSTAIRMLVIELDKSGRQKQLEFCFQTISLGKDVYSVGYITRENIDAVLKTLKKFLLTLEEYAIPLNMVRAVATSAVKDAANRDYFIDRIAIATGIKIEIVSDTDICRYIYLSLRLTNLLDNKNKEFGNRVICEVSGGRTIIMVLDGADVSYIQISHIGALQSAELFKDSTVDPLTVYNRLKKQIHSHVEGFIKNLPSLKNVNFTALGGDISFAVSLTLKGKSNKSVDKISVKDLSSVIRKLSHLSPSEIAKEYDISLIDAEVLLPSLLTYRYLAEYFDVKEIQISSASMRHGIALEMILQSDVMIELERQVYLSSLKLGERYCFDRRHAEFVAKLAIKIFTALSEYHKLGVRQRIYLAAASLLHDIGTFINLKEHHKHSAYIVKNSEIFGVNSREKMLISLIVRYHRKSMPTSYHSDYVACSLEERMVVAKLAAILRIADALDNSRSGQIEEIIPSVKNGIFIIECVTNSDIYLEEAAVKKKSDLFNEVFGMQVVLQKRSNAK